MAAPVRNDAAAESQGIADALGDKRNVGRRDVDRELGLEKQLARPRGGDPAGELYVGTVFQGRHVCAIRRTEGDDDPQRGIQASQPLKHGDPRSEEHTSELPSLMRISYAVFCLKKKKTI